MIEVPVSAARPGRRSVLVALALAAVLASAESAEAKDRWIYRIVGGSAHYHGSATLSCAAGVGSCHLFDSGYDLTSMSVSSMFPTSLSQ